jgi:hypothetical protein
VICLQAKGIILHLSPCTFILQHGFDFFIQKDGTMLIGPNAVDPSYIHVALECDSMQQWRLLSHTQKEQLFVLQKLALHLSALYDFKYDDITAHTSACPGEHFPWSQLVISLNDGYH